MTVIAAARTRYGVTLAADSQTTAGWAKLRHESPKLWVSGQYAMGAAGDLRTIQVVEHHVTWPKWRSEDGTTWEKHLIKELVPAMRQGLNGHGVIETDKGCDRWSATLLVANGDQLAAIYGNGCVFVAAPARFAVGSGAAEAFGHLGETGPWKEADVIEAARRATITDVGCSGDITVVDTQRLKVRTAT